MGCARPWENSTGVDPNVVLDWCSRGAGALYHDVYFGTDASAVFDADHDSDEFKGTQTGRFYDPCTLDWATTYYWRIDQVGQACTRRGGLWSFTTAHYGPVAWWEFDEGEGTIAYDSALDNDGTLKGDPNWVPGYIGSGALDFDGEGDYVQVADHDSLTPTARITVLFWIYNRGGQDAGIYKYVPSPSGGMGSMAYNMGVLGSNGRVWMWVFASPVLPGYIESNGSVGLNEWHHVALTFSWGQGKVYVDGQFDNSNMMGADRIMNDVHPLIIGGYWDSTGPYKTFLSRLNGMMDDVRIYDRPLTADEVQQLHQQ